MIESLDEILALFPEEPRTYTSREIHTPCPFCKGSGKNETTYRGHIFRGEDRFIFRKDKPPYCRRCQRAYSYQEIVNLLLPGSQVSEDLEFATKQQKFDKPNPPQLASEMYVRTTHKQVKRGYWHKFGWTDAVIDRFLLGYGTFWAGSSRAKRHLIPFISRKGNDVLAGWSFEGRLDKEDKAKEERNIKTGGLVKGHFWYVQDAPDSKVLAISEGPKDGISAWVLGYKNFIASYSSTFWDESIGDFIKEQGYEKVVIFGDNDQPGRHFNEQVSLDLKEHELEIYALDWTMDTAEGGDTTDLLASKGIDDSNSYIDNFLVTMDHVVRRGYIEHYPDVDPGYVKADPQYALTVDEIRAEMKRIPYEFIRDYKNYYHGKKGAIKILAAPPGVGKSHLLVRVAEDFARQRLAKIEQDYRDELKAAQEVRVEDPYLQETLKDIKVKKKSPLSVLYLSPYVNGWEDIIAQGYDPDLWYNYQARKEFNEETGEGNCKQFGTVTALAKKGYASRNFCETSCPAKEWCMKKGYLKQDAERQEKPITFARHASMDTSLAKDSYRLLIIDENITGVFDREVGVGLNDLHPVSADWANVDVEDDDYDSDTIDSASAINDLVDGLRSVISHSEDLSGLALTKKLDFSMSGKLKESLQKIDLALISTQYQPENVRVLTEKEVEKLPARCLPDIVRILREEAYHNEPYNTRLYTLDGKFTYNTLQKVHVPYARPMLVADGTAEPELYRLLFNREVSIYKPEVRSPHAHTTVFQGSDFTWTTINKELGSILPMVKAYNSNTPRIVETLDGEIIDLNELPEEYRQAYESELLKKIFMGVDYIMADVRNKNLLVVTYKRFKSILETKLSRMYPGRIAMDHYGNLRGTNRYKDFTTALLIGCYRVPYQVLHRKAQAWAALAGYDQYIRPELIPRSAPYHSRDDGHSYVSFKDDFADMFVNAVEMGEAQQALDRIRLYNGEYRHAYLMMSRPVAKWVTDVVKLKDAVDPEENQLHVQAKLYMKKFYLEQSKWPTYNKVRDEFEISTSTIKKLREDLMNGTFQV